MPFPRRFVRLLSLPWALLAATLAGRARGDAAAFQLSWDAPPGCPSEVDVRDEMARLAPSTAPAAGRPLEARASVRPGPAGRWAGAFRVEHGAFAGERQFEAEACADVARAFALVVALALDPDGPPPAPAPAEPPRPAAPPRAAPAPAPIAWTAGAGLRVQAGLLPGLAPGLGLDLGARWRGNGVDVSGLFMPECETELTGLSGARGRYELLGAGLTGCHSWPLGGVEVDACARTRWGVAGAKSRGVTRESSGRALWGGAGLLGALRVPLGPQAALRAELEGGASVRRPRFVIEGAGAGYDWPRLYAGASLGGELHF